MFVRRTALGDVAPETAGSTFFDRLLATPLVDRGIVTPLYEAGEAKAWTSIKSSIGPWVVGIGAALLFVNLFLVRELHRKRG